MPEPTSQSTLTPHTSKAVRVLNDGGVIAYPTEYCYGLGCNPLDQSAVNRILSIKGRAVAQGLILVAAELLQVQSYADLEDLQTRQAIIDSWPGPTTWLLPKRENTPQWISGEHQSIAMRISAHPLVRSICLDFGGAIVSTSANRSAQPALLSAKAVFEEMSKEVDLIVDGNLSEQNSERSASQIFDAITGEQLR